MEVIVVDNASGDGIAKIIRDEFPWVECFQSDINLGIWGGPTIWLLMILGRLRAFPQS